MHLHVTTLLNSFINFPFTPTPNENYSYLTFSLTAFIHNLLQAILLAASHKHIVVAFKNINNIVDVRP